MYCKHCGAEIHNNAVVCIKCGCSVADIPQNKGVKSGIFFILATISFILSGIFAAITSHLNSTQLTGNAVAFMRKAGDTKGLAEHNAKVAEQEFFAYSFIALLILGLVFLVIGIVKKKNSK